MQRLGKEHNRDTVRGGEENMLSMPDVTSEQEKRVVDALVDFVIRVAKGKTTSDTEVSVLPEVAKLLLNFHM